MDTSNPPIFEAKLVLIGSSGVGKTSLMIRLRDGLFSPYIGSTHGAEHILREFTSGEYRLKVNICDTSGQERYKAIAPNYFKGAHIVLFIYDVGSPESERSLLSWIDEVTGKNPFEFVGFLVGNKADNAPEETYQISKTIQEVIDKKEYTHFFASAKTGFNVEEVFQAGVDQCVRLGLVEKNQRRKSSSRMKLAAPAPTPQQNRGCC